MTREELIEKEAAEYGPTRGGTFKAGVRWADKHPMSQWVAVEEGMPESGKPVVVTDGKGYIKVNTVRAKEFHGVVANELFPYQILDARPEITKRITSYRVPVHETKEGEGRNDLAG